MYVEVEQYYYIYKAGTKTTITQKHTTQLDTE
jgi:hypothetical protein